MAEYYVDSGAGSGGDGSIGNPFDALSDVEALALQPGDFVNLKRGSIWRENLALTYSGSAILPVTIRSYSTGNLPQIRGCDVKTGWVLDAGNVWYVTGITHSGHDYDTPQVVLFDGNLGNRQTSKGAVDSAYDWYWDTAASRVYIYSVGNPETVYTNPGVEFGAARGGISAAGGASHYYILDLEVFGNDGGAAAYVYRGTDWTFDNFHITHGSRTGIDFRESTYLEVINSTMIGNRYTWWGWRGIYCFSNSPSYPGGNMTVHHNTIQYWSNYAVQAHAYSYVYDYHNVDVHDNDCSHSLTGVYLSYVDTAHVYDNTCDDNLIGYAGGEQYGMAVQTGQNIEFDHNVCTNGNIALEVWAHEGPEYPESGPCSNISVHHNWFGHNDEEGFMNSTGNVHGLFIYDNVIFDSGRGGIFLGTANKESTNVRVYHNTLYYNNRDDVGYADIYTSTGVHADTVIKNNILYNTDRICLRSANTSPQFIHSHNTYYRASGTVIQIGTTNYTLAQVTTWEPTAIAADPKFTSLTPGSEDFHLLSNSPCIDAVQDVGITTDYDDNPRPV